MNGDRFVDWEHSDMGMITKIEEEEVEPNFKDESHKGFREQDGSTIH